MTTSNEEEALVTLREAIAQAKISAFEYALHCSKLTAEELGYCGHKTVEAAILYAIRDGEKSVNKLTAAHLKRFPD